MTIGIALKHAEVGEVSREGAKEAKAKRTVKSNSAARLPKVSPAGCLDAIFHTVRNCAGAQFLSSDPWSVPACFDLDAIPRCDVQTMSCGVRAGLHRTGVALFLRKTPGFGRSADRARFQRYLKFGAKLHAAHIGDRRG